MSGGVDSTVAALLLQKQGYDVTGVYMKMHDNDAYHKNNFAKAKKTGEYLGIDVHFLDVSDQFQKDVVDYFVDTYARGHTPNPCVVCNRTIKFGIMMDFADSLGIEKVSTGHYLKSDGRYVYMAADKSLEDIAAQKESNEICFVENDDYIEVLAKYMDVDRPGEVLDADGNVIGSHKGYVHYTIGKRRGFRIDGAHDPHYVLSLEPEHNRIIVGRRDELDVQSFGIENINLFEKSNDFRCSVKVRYRTRAVPARVTVQGDKGFVELDEPVFGLARGQFAVFYDDERLLGGGVIV